MDFVGTEALTAQLPYFRSAPRDEGTVVLIVRRPAVDEREVLQTGELDPAVGLVGDTWKARASKRTKDGSAHPDMQLTLVNTRFLEVLAGPVERWPLAGDQLYVDFDLSEEALPAGTQIAVGNALVEITAQPHTGCAKYSARYGSEGWRFVNSPEGSALRLRGVNAKVVTAGTVSVGDRISRASLQPTTPGTAAPTLTTRAR